MLFGHVVDGLTLDAAGKTLYVAQDNTDQVAVIDTAEKALASLGYAVARNTPYAGGFTIRHYGRPAAGVHVLQIEINRALYMDEETMERGPYLPRLTDHMSALAAALGPVGEAVLARP